MKALVIDYEMGNLGSVKRSLEECGAEALVSSHPDDLKNATHIILPGVGAFRNGMRNLERNHWIPEIKKAANKGVPILGICLGMQLLADHGFEGGETSGLGLISGKVTRLVSSDHEKIPHVGWNEVHQKKEHFLFKNILNGTDFYFVHSYHFVPDHETAAITQTPYCGEFVSAVADKNVFGVQFHPEKSSKPGFQLFRNFLTLSC